MTFGEKFKAEREKRKLTQQEVADALGINRRMITRYENGISFPRTKDAYRKIILIGDAEPHPTPRGTGKYTKQLVAGTAKATNIVIDAIIVPDDKSARGR